MQDVSSPPETSDNGQLAPLDIPVEEMEFPDSKVQTFFRSIPFAFMHVACIGVWWVGFSWVAFGVCLLMYAVRMFAITAFYHRYFSHKAFKTSRFCQFIFGVLGCSAVQRGPLWWASNHRHHHKFSDDENDMHSPRQHGFWYSHLGWFLTARACYTNLRLIPDLAKFPELRFLDRIDKIIPAMLGVATFFLGMLVSWLWPESRTSAWQMLIWGFFISTVITYHITYLVNSLAHVVGSKRYPTKDDSRNNFWIALFTFGEGWHNNHHHYQASARQGFFWWEIDFSYYMLVVMSWFGLVWDLKQVPKRILEDTKATIEEPAPESA